ncbi:hypothetical protein SDC9_41745 [bioreactor metagenome]|uniref:Uncharacterized protein n=1 Tax=bioreactor metagenome TaxID=1076179 RepID=A0A644VZ41_9ZZZZ
MVYISGNIPNIKNSNSIDQSEIQNAKQNMNSAGSKTKILGAELTSNISESASLGMTNSVLSLNSSTSVESELQDVKNTVHKSGKQGLL